MQSILSPAELILGELTVLCILLPGALYKRAFRSSSHSLEPSGSACPMSAVSNTYIVVSEPSAGGVLKCAMELKLPKFYSQQAENIIMTVGSDQFNGDRLGMALTLHVSMLW